VKILEASTPIVTTDAEAGVKRYRALTGEDVAFRFDVLELGITIARVANFALISGTEPATRLMRTVRATLAVDSVQQFQAVLQGLGFTILQPPVRRNTGINMVVSDPDGSVLEFVEALRSPP